MRCANCHAESPREAAKCSACGAALSRRGKRRGVALESDSPFAGPVEESNRNAIWAYRIAICGLIPGLGLGLGPVALVWGLLARLRGRNDADFTARGPANVAILLGVLNTFSNWLGLWLMIQGLTSVSG